MFCFRHVSDGLQCDRRDRPVVATAETDSSDLSRTDYRMNGHFRTRCMFHETGVYSRGKKNRSKASPRARPVVRGLACEPSYTEKIVCRKKKHLVGLTKRLVKYERTRVSLEVSGILCSS